MQLTIKQAVSYTGKSANTLRRLIKKYSLSTHEYSRYFSKKGGKYYIDRDFLKRHYDVAESAEEGKENTQLDLNLVEHLKEQNIELNARLKELTHVIAHQSKIIADKDEQLKLLTAPVEGEQGGKNEPTIPPFLLIAGGLILGLIIAAMAGLFG